MRITTLLLAAVILTSSLTGCSVFSPTVARSHTVVKPKTYKRAYEPGKDKKKQGAKRVKMY